MKKRKNDYYKKFIYRIEKKLSVEDYFKIKDYAKLGVYLYIIHDNIDNNRFLYLSSKHYEENTKLNPETFKFNSIVGFNESIHLRFCSSKFGVKFFKLSKEKANLSLMLKEVITSKSKTQKIFKKFKVHTKKIVLDNPDWYLEFLLNKNCKSHKKKVYQLLLANNKYNPEIIYNSISMFFKLQNPDYQKFNDHTIVLDEGKTGKSSLIGYMGEKIDNISIAGLYGSSDGKNGKFRGGIVTTTKKGILIDEINELIKNQKNEKILSVLNSLLENGTYNYRKQFGQKIRAGNLFFFMGNISEELNFPLILAGTFGNVETIGRRIGIITYNDQLNGFEKGNIRAEKPNPYLLAISIFMSNIFNSIIENPKYVKKLYVHKEYLKLEKYYNKEISKMISTIEEPITKNFFKSHKSSIDRITTRGLKIWIFNNINKFIIGEKEYNNHTIFEILEETKKHLEQNLINLRNISEHIKDYSITNKIQEINTWKFKTLTKTYQKLLKFFWLNKSIITQKGINITTSKLTGKTELKFILQNYKRQGIPNKHKNFLLEYGLNISEQNNNITFRIINIKAFESKIEGVFTINDTKDIKAKKVAKKWNKENIEELDLSEDLH